MRTMTESRRRIGLKVLAILVSGFLIAGVVGCNATHFLTVDSTAGGEVTVPGEGRYEYRSGQMVNLVAVAHEDHRFVEWTGDVSTIDDMKAATTWIAMDDDYSITANFVTVYDLSISSTVGGFVTKPGEGEFTYDQGTIVSLMTTQATGYRFVGWAGDVNTIADVDAAATTITMNGDYSITARFEEKVPVVFACPNLEAAVRQALGIPEGDIYPSDMEGLTSLNAWDEGISNLTGLEYATGLTDLALHDNLITDISPLAGLTNLTDLSLAQNQITDISPLAGLIGLTSLHLFDNQIGDISPLAGLTNLALLTLMENQVSDISPLADLTNLNVLWFDGNQISDISPLANLTNLRLLIARGNRISDVSPLEKLSSLFDIDLSSNLIVDISPLEGLEDLWGLRLDDNQISDIKPLEGLTSLVYLEAGGNQINDISPLAELTGLWRLSLDSNQISDISPLAGLIDMRELQLDDNRISDISALEGLTNLTDLRLRNNQISDISPLANLTKLEWLFLGPNQIRDISPLVDNPGLGEGVVVWLEDNPLGEQSINEYIPALEARGVWVIWGDHLSRFDRNSE